MLPVCNIENPVHDLDQEILTEEVLQRLMEADCWAISVDGEPLMDTYDLPWNDQTKIQHHEAAQYRKRVHDHPEILLNQGYRQIEIYMFGDRPWKLLATLQLNGKYRLQTLISAAYQRGV